jgi:hypothetical protein
LESLNVAALEAVSPPDPLGSATGASDSSRNPAEAATAEGVTPPGKERPRPQRPYFVLRWVAYILVLVFTVVTSVVARPQVPRFEVGDMEVDSEFGRIFVPPGGIDVSDLIRRSGREQRLTFTVNNLSDEVLELDSIRLKCEDADTGGWGIDIIEYPMNSTRGSKEKLPVLDITGMKRYETTIVSALVGTKSIGAKESRTISISVISRQAGKWTLRFEVYAGGRTVSGNPLVIEMPHVR